jgi:hypothetical protein
MWTDTVFVDRQGVEELVGVLLEPSAALCFKFLRVVSRLAHDALIEELAEGGKLLKPGLPPISAIHACPVEWPRYAATYHRLPGPSVTNVKRFLERG